MSVDLIRQIVDHVVGETLIGGRKSGAMVADGETAGSIEQFKTLLAEKLRTAGGSPGSSSGTSYLVWNAAYQNSAMGSPVGAYLYKDADGVIWKVYEPVRNNVVSRSQYAYADSIDKFPFDRVTCYGSALNDVKLLNLASDSIIRECSLLQSMVINVNSKTGFQLREHFHLGFYGTGSPNNAEIYITGNNVTILNNTCWQRSFIDTPDTDSTIQNNTLGQFAGLWCNGRKVNINTNVLDVFANLRVIKNDIQIASNKFREASEIYASCLMYDCSFDISTYFQPNFNTTPSGTVLSVNTGTKTIKITGDVVSDVGTIINKGGSNGTFYDVVSATLNGGDTDIVVLQDVSAVSVDETISFIKVLANANYIRLAQGAGVLWDNEGATFASNDVGINGTVVVNSSNISGKVYVVLSNTTYDMARDGDGFATLTAV